MKKILKLLFISILFNSISSVALAEYKQECIMLDSSGKPMDLSHLCNHSITTPSLGNSTIPSPSSASGVFTAKIKRREFGIPVIEVKFNNQHTFEMLIDTGASLTILTEPMAKTLNIQPEGNMLLYTANDAVYVPRGRVASVAAAGIHSSNLDIAIAPSLEMGLLGQNFFGHYDVTIKQDVIEFRAR